jgi:putative oxidoreductase
MNQPPSFDDIMDSLRPSTINLGRVLLGLFFLISGIKAAMDFPSFLSLVDARNLPYPEYLAMIALGFKIIGGISLTGNIYVGWGRWLLIIFTIIATGLFHNPVLDPMQLNNFLKNMGIIGGLLLV